MSVAPSLPGYIDALTLLGDESRIRLCALLRERELCVTDLVRVTGIAQSRVSTHLGRLREAGFVRDRRKGPQAFYAPGRRCAAGARPGRPRRGDGVRRSDARAATRSGCASSTPSGAAACPSRSPTRWSATIRRVAPGSRLRVGIAALLRLGDVLDVGSGDGAAAARAGALLPLAHLHRHQRSA